MMWWFKKKKTVEKHIHNYIKSIGKYYKLYRTSYENCFDNVIIYERRQCQCGAYKDICISSDEFLPSLYKDDSEEKDFIKDIKKNGIKEEYELSLETKKDM